MDRFSRRFIAPALVLAATLIAAPATFAQTASADKPPVVFGAAGIYTLIGETAIDKTAGMPGGNPAIITLKEQMGTGYSWFLKSNKPQGAATMTLDKVVHESTAGKPGGEDSADFHFATSGKGKVDLEFVYVRPWEPNSPSKTIKITVDLE